MKLPERLLFGTTYLSGSGTSGTGVQASGATIADSDLFHMVDVSDITTDGVAGGSSFKVPMSVARTYFQIGSPNIYNIDGTLTALRTLSTGGYALAFQTDPYNYTKVNATTAQLLVSSNSGTTLRLMNSYSSLAFSMSDAGFAGMGIAPITGYRLYITNTVAGYVPLAANTAGAGSGTNYAFITSSVGGGSGRNIGTLSRAWFNTGFNIGVYAEAGSNTGGAISFPIGYGPSDVGVLSNVQSYSNDSYGAGFVANVNYSDVLNTKPQYGIVLNVKNTGGTKYIGNLVDGTEGAGKTLQCVDADGNCNWQGGFNSSGLNPYTNFEIVEGKIVNAT